MKIGKKSKKLNFFKHPLYFHNSKCVSWPNQWSIPKCKWQARAGVAASRGWHCCCTRSGLVGCCLGASRRRVSIGPSEMRSKKRAPRRCDIKETRARSQREREREREPLVSPHFGFMDGTQRPRVNKRSNFTMSWRGVRVQGKCAKYFRRRRTAFSAARWSVFFTSGCL